MAQERLHIRIPETTKDKLESIANKRDCSMTQASHDVLEHGLDYLGYNGGRSRFQSLVHQISVGLFHVGATLTLLSLLGSLSMLIIGISVLCGSLSVIGIGRVLTARYDPALTQMLPEVRIE
jgi:hypothetical protein